MSTVFLKVLNLSITASWLILAIVLVRLFIKKAPKWISCILWGLVAIRLVCPFSLESVLSLIPSSETIPSNIEMMNHPAINSGIPVINEMVNPIIANSFTPDLQASTNPLQIIVPILSVVWLAGVVVMLLYGFISYVRLKKSVRASVLVKDNIFSCDEVKSPFILGIIKPFIYIPSVMSESTFDYVITHETGHIMRHDHWWKLFGFFILSVYWFNPLCWLAYILLCRDIEMACDERVIRDMTKSSVAAYSQALLDCSIPRRRIVACPLAFGGVGVKERVKFALHYKKPAFWILLIAILICVVLAVCFLTNPSGSKQKDLPADLQVFIDTQLADRLQTDDTDDLARCLDWKVLGTEENGDAVTAYMWVMYEEYSLKNARLQLEKGIHIPAVITAEKENGQYILKEYWEPRDGSYAADDIMDRFPAYLCEEALNSEKYAAEQSANCEKMARNYFSVAAAYQEESGQISKPDVPLQEKYPQYFGLDTAKGLEVYIWQMAKDSYSCGLLPGRNAEYTQDELLNLHTASTSIEEMRTIVASYDVSKFDVIIHPIVMPHSNYHYDITEDYCKMVEELFWSDFPMKSLRKNPEITVSYVGWTECDNVFAGCLNADTMMLSSAIHLPIYKIDSKEQLDSFKARMGNDLNLNNTYIKIPSFKQVTACYEETFCRLYNDV